MKLKFTALLMMLFFMSIYSSAQQEDVHLIEPIIESPTMNERQAAIYSESKDFKNWGILKFGLDTIMDKHKGKGVKVCICDTGKPTHIKLIASIKESQNFTSDPSVEDGNGHSTHVAGIIHEIAPETEILIAKVLSDKGSGTNQGVAAGISWCVNQGANFINMSLGGSNPSSVMKEAIDFATLKGVTIIAAVGNRGQSDQNTIGYPARYDEVIAIGSINDQVKVSTFSSSGEEGDLVAAGEKILSTYKENTYRILSGTSMAAPFISGVAALYYEKHQSNTAIERMIEIGSTDMLPEGFDRFSFWGHVEPMLLFDFKTPPDQPTEPTPTEPTGKNQIWIFFGIVAVVILVIVLFYRKKE